MRPRSPYFVNALVDTLLIGGLSIATAIVFWGLRSSGHSLPGPGLAMVLAWVVNWPHFSASSYRLYRGKASIAQYPVTAILIPVVVLAAVIGCFRAPTTAGSALVKLYLLWSPFHFSGQSRGITLIYARRAGWELGTGDRAAFSLFFAASYFRLIFGQESEGGLEFLGGLAYPVLRVPVWLTWGAEAVEALFGLAVLLVFARHCRRHRGLRAPMVLLPALTQAVWFEAGSRLPEFNALVPFFHSLQYLLIAWAMQMRETTASDPRSDGHRSALRETLRWWILNIAGGVLLFWVLPAAARSLGVPAVAATPILFSAVQIHHFFVDGVIWKLRNPSVGARLAKDPEDPEGVRAVPGGVA